MKIHGTSPSRCKVLVEIVGEEEKEILMKKGKHGPPWINVAEIHVEEVPSLYLLLGHAENSPARVSNEIDFLTGERKRVSFLRSS